MNDAWGIVFFLIMLLVGIGAVSIHYRKKYEELKAWLIKTNQEFKFVPR